MRRTIRGNEAPAVASAKPRPLAGAVGVSIIQARFGEDAYPISRFIIDRAKALGLTRADLVRRFGYTRIGKGHQALHATLTTGVVPPQIGEHLAEALDVDESLLAAVIAATERQRRDEAGKDILAREIAYRTAFRPSLRAEMTVSAVSFAAIIGTARLRNVMVPDDVWLASPEHRDRALKPIIDRHYRASEGRMAAFGAILGYTAVTLPGYGVDFGFAFDLDGNRVGPMREVARLGEWASSRVIAD